MAGVRNTGKDAEDAFVERKESQPRTVVERFYDASDLRGINKGRPVGDFPKPSDFLVTEDGATHFAEVKSTQNAKRFPFSQIEDGQRSACLRHTAAGGVYTFYIFTYGLGKWFKLPGFLFAQLLEDGAASVSFEELSEWV